jgi:ribosomal protein L11 methyltransferase
MTYQQHLPTADTVMGTLITDEQSARRVADRFAEAFFGTEVAVSLVDHGHGQWRVAFYFGREIDEGSVRDLAVAAAGAKAAKGLRFERIAAKNWVAESLLGLKPITVGRFMVHGAHDRDRVPPNRIGIEIEAALAFGTGHHGSTRGCLVALDRLCKSMNSARRKQISPLSCKGRGEAHRVRRPKTLNRLALARRPSPFRQSSSFPHILDLGTGSGVLAIAAAKSLRRRVLASDIDALAVRVARDNARFNRRGPFVRICRANGLAAASIRAGAPFDLVFANILLAPLQRLATPMTRIVVKRGRVVLSGLLNAQANAARAAYPHFTLERRIAIEEWTTLVLRRGW